MSGAVLVSARHEAKAATYVAALRAVGVPAEAIQVVTPEVGAEDLPARAAAAAGLVLCGGPDVDPVRYGEQTRPDARVDVNPGLDAQEWALLDGAGASRVPVWAVCRGIQVVNVYLGGTLWQDIPTQLPSGIDHYPKAAPESLAHEVRVVAPETALGVQLAGEPPRVNSRHHQAVKDLAPGLLTAALSPDGLIEACELPAEAGWWLRAVQWHPENLVALPPQRELWQAFAREALGAR
ncbi:MAG TPA: gamma-glutamyl-gamma-aminobutyrate hydrolase family protein [Thermoanaerobaculia bacterium]|nr:gamma-glutamyl-gamma-aminobutyrate hydrolase family protein [Thermoanaerobaculia bacterium]